MLYKNGKLKKFFAIMLAVFCFTALSSIAVFAIDIDGDTWQKVDSSAGINSFSVEDTDFVIIKQATGAVIWLKTDLNTADREALIEKINEKDPSILNSCSDGIEFTTQTNFILKDVLNFTGVGGKYDAEITVAPVSDVLTMTINGSYSHYCYGTFVKETTTVVTTTTETQATTSETTAQPTTTTTTEPPVTTTTEPPATTTTEPPATTTTEPPATTSETTVPEVTITTATLPQTNETSTPPETSESTAVFTTSTPPSTNETSVTAITDPNPPYTGADFGISSLRAIITAVVLFGSLSGIAVLVYAMRKTKSK